MKICATTVMSTNHYQWYAPLFIYSFYRAYPDVTVRIFSDGDPSSNLGDALGLIPKDARWEIIPQDFNKYKHSHKASTYNCLRYLIPAKKFEGFTHVYFTDVDFIVFPHNPTHWHYLQRIMEKTKQPYAGAKGPYGKLRRRYGQDPNWRIKCARMAGGCFFVEADTWFRETRAICSYYKKILARNRLDNYGLSPALDREYDEVMLYHMCASAGFKLPTKRNCFATGKIANSTYRDIHLGDFKFNRRTNVAKMSRILKTENVSNFLALEKDETWQKICSVCEQNKQVGKIMNRLRSHIKVRSK